MQSRWPDVTPARAACLQLLNTCLSRVVPAALCSCLVISLSVVPAWSQTAAAPADDQLQLAIEALQRLKDMDLEANPALKAAVQRVLQRTAGTPQFVNLVRDFRLRGQSGPLLDYAIRHPDEAAGVEAIRLALADESQELVRKNLESTNAAPLVRVLGHVADKSVTPLLQAIAADTRRAPGLRKEAMHGLAQTEAGAEFLLNEVNTSGRLSDLKEAVVAELRNARWPDIRSKATTVQTAHEGNGGELPPIAELARLKGVASRGAGVFGRETVGCVKCHRINGEGADFGPDLSEIGTKLAKEAIYEAILDPSAGISFGYEAWQLELRDGEEAFGLLASETADEVAIKAPSGIVSRYKKADVVRRIQQKASIMPAGLAQTMSQQDLVDLVEYLSSLRKFP